VENLELAWLDSLRCVLFVDVASFFSPSQEGGFVMSPRKRAATKQKPAVLVCPECGKTFTRPASLGAHRNRAHGIAGASAAARANAKKTRAGRAATARSASRGKTAARTTTGTRRKTPTARLARSTPKSANGQRAPVDRDKLLQSLFPTGITAREDAMRQVNAWLDEAERLARMR